MRLPRVRITIAKLMILIFFSAVLTVAISKPSFFEPSIWWASSLYTLDLFTFAGAALIGLIGRGRRRAVSVGSAMFGILYLLTVFGVGVPAAQNGVSQPPLITTGLLYRLSPVDGGRVLTVDNGRTGESFKVTDASQVFPALPPGAARVVDLPEFRRVGHCLFALAIASIGGWIGLLAWAKREPEDRPRSGMPEV